MTATRLVNQHRPRSHDNVEMLKLKSEDKARLCLLPANFAILICHTFVRSSQVILLRDNDEKCRIHESTDF